MSSSSLSDVDEPENVISTDVIGTWISSVTSDLSESKVKKLCKKIQEKGPTCKEDLKFISEDKIQGVLSDLRTARFVQELKHLISSGSSSKADNVRAKKTDSFGKVITYDFDYSLITGSLLTHCQKNEPLATPQYKQLVSIVAQYCKEKRPSNVHMTSYVQGVTMNICLKYSGALLETYEGKVINNGNQILQGKVYNKIDNMRLDRNVVTSGPKRRRLAKQQALPNNDPALENLQACENAKEVLKAIFQAPRDTWDAVLIRRLLSESYALQRKTINEVNLITESIAQIIFNEWPFLFHPIGSAVHFTAGGKNNPNPKLDQFMATNVSNLRYFLVHSCGARVAKLDMKLQRSKQEIVGVGDSRSLVLLTLLEMVTQYFNEDFKNLVVLVNEDIPLMGYSYPNNISTDTVIPLTPCLVGKTRAPGFNRGSQLANNDFYVFVDGVNVGGPFSGMQGMRVIFPTHFMLNVGYHAKVASTMEFYEIVFVGQNPDRISKKVGKAISDFAKFKEELDNAQSGV